MSRLETIFRSANDLWGLDLCLPDRIVQSLSWLWSQALPAISEYSLAYRAGDSAPKQMQLKEVRELSLRSQDWTNVYWGCCRRTLSVSLDFGGWNCLAGSAVLAPTLICRRTFNASSVFGGRTCLGGRAAVAPTLICRRT